MGKKIKNQSTTEIKPNLTAKKPEIKQSEKGTPVKWWLLSAVIGFLSILLYSNTFQHRFVLDDHGIIKNNKITKAPVSWENTKTIFTTPLRKGDVSDLENSLYRPFVKLLFNIEWNMFNGDSHSFHVVNALLYAITCIFFFMVLYRVFDRKWLVPFLTTLLFLVHPLHVESVANVKSADEILSLLGILIALRCIQLYFDKEKVMYLGFAVIAYLMGSYSKESTIVALAIFPLFIYYFTPADLKRNIMISSIFVACSAFFLFCRWSSLHMYKEAAPVSLMDNYMAEYRNDFFGRLPSAIRTVGTYLKTFFIPHPLSCDYSFSTFTTVTASSPYFLTSFFVLTALFVYALRGIMKKEGIGFAILWFFISISIVSNIFFVIGTSFGERLMFTPSAGLCLALVWVLYRYLPKKEGDEQTLMGGLKSSPILVMIVLAVSSLYAVKTYSRNNDWKSDYLLFSRDVQYFPNSTHLLFYMGNHLSGDERKSVLQEEMLQQGYNYAQFADSNQKENLQSINYLQKSLSIFPELPSDGYNQLGKAYYNIGYPDSAFKYYIMAKERDSTNAIFTNNLGTVYFTKGQQDAVRGRTLLAQGQRDSANYYFMRARGQVMESKNYFLKAHKIDTSEADFSNNAGCAYGDTQNPDSAIYYFALAARSDLYDTTSRKFLDMTYRNKGDISHADSSHAEYVEAVRRNREKFEANR